MSSQAPTETFNQALAGRSLASGPGWIAIHKPDWMSAHNETNESSLLGERELEARWNARSIDAVNFARAIAPAGARDPSPAHRLDVGSSGVLLLATSAASARALAEALAASVKTYVAVARGAVAPEPAAWQWPLSDRAEGRRDPQGPRPLRKECRTAIHAVRSNKWFSFIEARLETGRTHQIRRHAALAKHALVGDRRYGDARHAEIIFERYGVSRLCLHARRLEFPCGAPARLQLPARIEAPEPPEFARLLEGEQSR